jgi:hypothetical protein
MAIGFFVPGDDFKSPGIRGALYPEGGASIVFFDSA